MLYDAPVASSNATCLPEVYGDAAAYFDPMDTVQMAGVIEQIVSEKKLRDQLIKTGRAQVKKYSWRRMAEQTHAVYVDALR